MRPKDLVVFLIVWGFAMLSNLLIEKMLDQPFDPAWRFSALLAALFLVVHVVRES